MDKFSFYITYWNILDNLSSRQFKKLMKALSEYAHLGILPRKLPNKTYNLFYDIKRVIDAEEIQENERIKQEELREKRSRAGKKGMRNRWR